MTTADASRGFQRPNVEAPLAVWDYCFALERHNEELTARCAAFATALREIANSDYRGNRSPESEIAYLALVKEGAAL